jgi:Fic family protein
MGSFVAQAWAFDPSIPGPRRARACGSFQAYIPDPLSNISLNLDARVAADLADAERAILELDNSVLQQHGPHQLEVLDRLLLRAEAVGSSRVEGLVISPRKLALADLDPAFDPSGRALEVVGNIHALQDALARAAGPVSIEELCAIHAKLLSATSEAALGGVVRTEQNWIGGYTPLDAEYVPPPPEEVPALLEDLCSYLNQTDHSPLVQAALAHAQFESIHPFADGNGRTGRALLQLVLRKRGLCRRFVPPISLVLATWSKRYVAALTSTRSQVVDWNSWLELVAQAVMVACSQTLAYEQRISALVEEWKAKFLLKHGETRADAAVWALLSQLPAAPLITAQSAVALTRRSERAIDGAIRELVEAGVLKQVSGKVRYRLYEAVGVFELVTVAERALASPVGDTGRAPPVRSVPAKVVK